MAPMGPCFFAPERVHLAYQIMLTRYSPMQMETLTIDDLAVILNRARATIATEVTKAPHKLPPRLHLPGSRRVLWLKEDVENWLAEHRPPVNLGEIPK